MKLGRVLQVTYPDGEFERYATATDVRIADRNSVILEVLKDAGRTVIDTLVIANVRSWMWIPAEGSDRDA